MGRGARSTEICSCGGKSSLCYLVSCLGLGLGAGVRVAHGRPMVRGAIPSAGCSGNHAGTSTAPN
eukprot:scaffold16426_cov109-Isochrysis_galbana.AAC.6